MTAPDLIRRPESSPLPYCLLQRSDELLQTQPERLKKYSQFHHINPPLSAFALGDECLSFAKLLGELHLRHAGLLSRSFEGLQENGVPGGVAGLSIAFRERNVPRLLPQLRIVQHGL